MISLQRRVWKEEGVDMLVMMTNNNKVAISQSSVVMLEAFSFSFWKLLQLS